MSRVSRYRLLAVAAIFALAAGCSAPGTTSQPATSDESTPESPAGGANSSDAADVPADELATVRVVESLSGMWGLTVRTAEDQGFFEDAGVNVEQLSFGEAEDNVLLLSEAIDFASLAPLDVAVMRNEGADVVSLGGLFNQQSAIFVRKDDDRTLADLEGTPHGEIGLGSTTSRQLQVLLNVTDGIDYVSYFDHVVSGTPTLEPLLARGDIDSMAMFPPRSIEYASEGYRIVYGPISKEWEEETGYPLLLGGLVFRADWVHENPEATRRFIEALRNTADYIVANAQEVVDANAELLGIDEATVDAFVEAIERGDFYDIDLDADRIAAEQSFLEAAKDVGVLDEVPEDLFLNESDL